MGSKVSKRDNNSHDESLIDQLVTQTSFTREKLVQMRTQFLRECPNGRLSQKDFVNMFIRMHQSDVTKNVQGTQKYYEYIFRALDQDDSGFIDFGEFIIAFSMISPGSTEEKIRMAFRIFDLGI
jgi:Ca2+-binding EF-hand superfamily protein